MSSEERKKILQMVEEGKISAEEAASLMRALEDDADEGSAEVEVEVIEKESGYGYERVDAPEFEEIKARARRFSMIPLWTGIFVTVFSAWIIYSIQQNAGTNFWSYCMILPLMLGVLLIALVQVDALHAGSMWMWIDAMPNLADGPRHSTLGFPIPFANS